MVGGARFATSSARPVARGDRRANGAGWVVAGSLSLPPAASRRRAIGAVWVWPASLIRIRPRQDRSWWYSACYWRRSDHGGGARCVIGSARAVACNFQPTIDAAGRVRSVITGAHAVARRFRKAIDGVRATAEQPSALRAVWITHILSARRRQGTAFRRREGAACRKTPRPIQSHIANTCEVRFQSDCLPLYVALMSCCNGLIIATRMMGAGCLPNGTGN